MKYTVYLVGEHILDIPLVSQDDGSLIMGHGYLFDFYFLRKFYHYLV